MKIQNIIAVMMLVMGATSLQARAQTPELSLPPLPEVGGLDMPVIPPAADASAAPVAATPAANTSPASPATTTPAASGSTSLAARASADAIDDLLPPAATSKPGTTDISATAADTAPNNQPNGETNIVSAQQSDPAPAAPEKTADAPSAPVLPAIPTEVEDAPKKPPSLAEEAAAKGVVPPPLQLPPMPEATAQALLSGQPLGPDDEDEGDEEAELPPVKVVRKPTVRDLPPLKKSFAPIRHSYNYKRTMLPPSIYKREYSAENRHLPKATTREDYDRHLFGAVAANDINAARAFLNMGKSVNLTNANGETLLMTAVRYGAVDTARLLLARGANPKLAGSNGVTALQLAEMSGQQTMAQVLRARGA